MAVKNGMKYCTKCKTDKSVDGFHKNVSELDGLQSRCKACVAIYMKKRYIPKPRKIKSKFQIITDGKKQCIKCEKFKTVDAFYRDKNFSSGFSSWCKHCERKRKQAAYTYIQSTQFIEDGMKTCSNCNKRKTTDKFFKTDTLSSGYSSWCKHCSYKLREEYAKTPEAKKAYYEYRARPEVAKRMKVLRDTPEAKAKRKVYRERPENKELRKAYFKAYNKRPGTKERNNERERLRRKNDLKFRLGKVISGAICSSLKAKGGRKAHRHWENLVGYTIEDLKNHLEKQFTVGMSWDSYGKEGWHVDHIIPIAKWNFTSIQHDDFKNCWALKNLQPLWWLENIAKGSKLERPFQPSLPIGVI